MRTLVKSTFMRRCFAVFFLLAVSAPVWAQSVASGAGSGARLGSADASLSIGFGNPPGGLTSNTHFDLGISSGIKVSERSTLLAEYNYLPLGSVGGVSASTQLLGVADRISFPYSGRVTPYLVVGGGYAHFGETGFSGENGFYLGGGGGASVYAGKNWGVRPELRIERQEFYFSGTSSGKIDARFLIGAFYQWGGTRSKNR
jgi:hypothetical protein